MQRPLVKLLISTRRHHTAQCNCCDSWQSGTGGVDAIPFLPYNTYIHKQLQWLPRFLSLFPRWMLKTPFNSMLPSGLLCYVMLSLTQHPKDIPMKSYRVVSIIKSWCTIVGMVDPLMLLLTRRLARYIKLLPMLHLLKVYATIYASSSNVNTYLPTVTGQDPIYTNEKYLLDLLVFVGDRYALSVYFYE